MRKLGWAVLCGLLGSTLACSAQKKCEQAYEQEAYVEAARLCEKAHRQTKDSLHLALAMESHSQLFNLNEVERLGTALLETPRKPQALYLLGVAADDRGERHKANKLLEAAYAEALAQRASGIAPAAQKASTRAALRLAFSSMTENKLEDSTTWVQRGLQEVKESADFKIEIFLLAALHNIETWLGNDMAAERALAQAETLLWKRNAGHQEKQYLLRLRAFHSMRQESWPLAEQQFVRLMELNEGKHCDADCLAAWNGLTIVHMRQGQLDKAEIALNEYSSLWSIPASVDVLWLRAELAAEQQAHEKVLDVLAEAQGMSLTEYERQWVATLRGNALANLGRKQEAEAALNEAIQHLESMHRSLVAPDQRSRFLRRYSMAFDLLFNEHINEGKVFEALEVAERLMAPTFMQLLSSTAPHSSGAEAMHALLQRTEQPLLPESSPPKLSSEKALELLNQDELLLFFEVHETLFRLWFHQGKLAEVQRLPLKELNPRLEDFALAPTSTEAEALGALLWPAALPQGARVQLVGQERLRRLPWGALRVRGQWLSAQNALAWAPSLKVAALLHARARQGGELIVIGNPTGDLPHAQAEAVHVAKQLKTEPLLGAQAQRAVFERLGNARLLHLAAHTNVEAKGTNISLADGKLYAHELLERSLAPQTVVLSSCASARSSDNEGLMSLSGSFLAAGSRQVVASLRSIHDAASAEFMQHFYAEGGLEEPAWALSKAQMKMTDHPVEQWSAFVLWGTVR